MSALSERACRVERVTDCSFCAPGFISGFLEGGEFNALVSMKVRNSAKRTDIRAEAQVALTAMGADIKGSANVTIAKENIDMNTECVLLISESHI